MEYYYVPIRIAKEKKQCQKERKMKGMGWDSTRWNERK